MENILNSLGSIASIAGLLLQGATMRHQQGGDSLVSLNGETIVANYEIAKSAAELSQIIDESILDVLTERIANATIEYRNRIKRAKAAQGLDAADSAAQRDICDILNRIKNRNDGKLPGEYYKKLWKSYKCELSF